MVGGADKDSVDVLAIEDLLVLFRCGRLGIDEFLGLFQVDVVDVADSCHADVGDRGERLHQMAAPATGAD